MSKSFRFDPDDEFGGDNLPPMSRKELKAARKARRNKEQALDEQMQPDDESERVGSSIIGTKLMIHGWRRS